MDDARDTFFKDTNYFTLPFNYLVGIILVEIHLENCHGFVYVAMIMIHKIMISADGNTQII